MKMSLAVGVIAAIASSPAMADVVRSRPPGAAVPTHRAAAPPAQRTHPAYPTYPTYRGHHDSGHAALRPPVVIRYVPVVRVPTHYPGSLPRLAVPVPAPYFVVSGSPAAREVMTFAEADAPQNWNWTRVDSVAALVPQKVRYTCPDSR